MAAAPATPGEKKRNEERRKKKGVNKDISSLFSYLLSQK
jgi:hypothetical protein